MAFLSDLFDSFTNQQATPQQTIIPTTDLLNRGYATATGLAPSVAALNQAYQPIITGTQLASENQVFGDAANQVQRGAFQSVLDNLNLGNAVPADLQDLITTNTLQQLGSSGIGTADAGKLFGARSLLSAGLDLGAQRRAEALGASRLLPSSTMQPQVQGIPDPMGIANAIQGEQAAMDQFANVAENTRRNNFSSLINTGTRILGMVAGGIIGAKTGDPVGGVQAGGAIGGSILGKSGVAGVGQQQAPQSAPVGGGFLSSLFGGGGGLGRFSAGGGQFYQGANGNAIQSSMASPVLG